MVSLSHGTVFPSDLTSKLFGGVCYLCRHRPIPLFLTACILAPLFTLQLHLLTSRTQPPNDQIKSSWNCLAPGLHVHLVVDYPFGAHFIILFLPHFCPFLSCLFLLCFLFISHSSAYAHPRVYSLYFCSFVPFSSLEILLSLTSSTPGTR